MEYIFPSTHVKKFSMGLFKNAFFFVIFPLEQMFYPVTMNGEIRFQDF